MGALWGKVIRKDYKFWAAVASSLRMGCLGLRDKRREMQAIRISLTPYIMGIAARQGDIPLLEECFQAGGDAYVVDYDRRTPLHIAASESDIWTVRYLISKGADVNARDLYNETPLKVAMRDKNIEIVKLLYEEGSRDWTDPVELGAELCNTAFMNDIKQMEAWLAGGVSCNSVDYDSRTPLHVAVNANQPEMVEFLLENDADPELRDRWNRTPFDNARRMGYQNIEKILLSHVKSGKRTDEVQKSHSLNVQFKRKSLQIDEARKLPPIEEQTGKETQKQTDDTRKPYPEKERNGILKNKPTVEVRKALTPKEQADVSKSGRAHIIMVQPSLIQKDLDEHEQQSLMGRAIASPLLKEKPRKQDFKILDPKEQIALGTARKKKSPVRTVKELNQADKETKHPQEKGMR